MQKEIVKSLKIEADRVGKIYSDPTRNNNKNKEVFTVNDIIPTSDNTATVIYEKNTGKKAAFFFALINNSFWWYFVPTDSHIVGMNAFSHYKLMIEKDNYKHNFEEVN